jgi:predicted nucleic acid-binding protein
MSEAAPRIVIDSSVVVKWFIADGEDDVPAARRLLDEHDAGALLLCAPAHVVLEVLNAIRYRGLSPSVLEDVAGWVLGAHLELAPLEPLAQRAAVLAATHDLTVYDAAFVALAESLDAELVTADRRLAACPACRTRLLGDTAT